MNRNSEGLDSSKAALQTRPVTRLSLTVCLLVTIALTGSIVDPVQDDQTHAAEHDKDSAGQEQDRLEDTRKFMTYEKHEIEPACWLSVLDPPTSNTITVQ